MPAMPGRRFAFPLRCVLAIGLLAAFSGGAACTSRTPPAATEAARSALATKPIELPESSVPAISMTDLAAHVRALSDVRTEGRHTGTPGEAAAVDYLVRAMKAIGLTPAGHPDDGSDGFIHPFEFTAGISLGPDNALQIEAANSSQESPPATAGLEVDVDWRPLAFSRSGTIEASAIVFVGYGLVAPAEGEWAALDDYAGIDVSDRWVMVLRDLPQSLDGARRQQLQRQASLRYKAMVARDRGARGVLFVSGPQGRFRHELAPLRFDASLAGTRIAVLTIRDEVADRLLAGTEWTLAALEARVDAASSDPSMSRDAASLAFEIPDTNLGARVDLVTERAQGHNVVGRLQVADRPSAQTIVLGAHFDHLGRGQGSSSLASGDDVGQIHPGADDNASGVAVLLEIAERLTALAASGVVLGERDFIFAAWSGEELGLLGSDRWAEDHVNPHTPEEGPIAYLNFDMVGRSRDRLIVQGLGSSKAWADLLEGAPRPAELEIITQSDSYLPTDVTSFYTRGVPVLNAFTGVHSEYHTPRDTQDLLDLEGMVQIGEIFGEITLALSRARATPIYRAQAAPAAGQGRSGFRVFLGTVPDYAQTDVSGVRLSGVAPDGPAEQAGLRSGDVIVEVDGKRIENLYDYTYSLEALRVGEPALIGVERAGERVDLEVVPTSRD